MLKNTNRIFLILALSLLLIFGTYSARIFAAEELNSNLKFGDYGEGVYLLQKLLNKDLETRVAVVGPGSPGQETRYFGRLTLSAVNKFQEKHKEAVLIPLGLTKSTGFVGPSTRGMFNKGLKIGVNYDNNSNVKEKINKTNDFDGSNKTNDLIVFSDIQKEETEDILPLLPAYLTEGSDFEVDISAIKESALSRLEKEMISNKDSFSELEKLASFWYEIPTDEEFYSKEAIDDMTEVINQNYKNEAFMKGLGRIISLVEEESLKEYNSSKSVVQRIIEFFRPNTAHAIINRPFGGRLIVFIPCTCNAGSVITVGPPTPGSYIFQPPLSQLKRNFALLQPGVWQLGIAKIPPIPCLEGIPPACVPIPSPATGTVLIMGTGLGF